MAYDKTVWKNDPNHTSPINAENLNKIEDELEKVSAISDETIDQKTGVNGEVYRSAGDALRMQIDNTRKSILAEEDISGCEILMFSAGYYSTPEPGVIMDLDTITGYRNDTVCAKCEVTPGEKIIILGNGYSSDRRLYAFADSTRQCIYRSDGNLQGRRIIDVPDNAAYMVVNILLSSGDYYAYKGISLEKKSLMEIKSAKNSIEEGSDILSGHRVLFFEQGFYRTATPVNINDKPTYSESIVCARCAAKPGEKFVVYGNGPHEGAQRIYSFSDANGNRLEYGAADFSGKLNLVAPADTAYLIVNILSSSPKYYAYCGSDDDFELDKSEQITWIPGYKIDYRYTFRITENASSQIAYLDAKKGDYIKITYNHYVSSSLVPISQNLGNCFERLVPPSEDHSVLEYEYVVPYDMSIILCSAIASFVSAVWKTNDKYKIYDKNILHEWDIFPEEKYNPLVVASARNPAYRAETMQKPFCLLHLSDHHGDTHAVAGAKRFMDLYGNYIDDCIFTGDMCNSKFPQYAPSFTLDGYNKLLLCIGNHDVYDVNGDAEEHGASYDNPDYWASPQQKYNQYIAPSVANWNVTQPANAETLGLCYYYKDYDLTDRATVSPRVSALRLIVLDVMAYDSAQHNWLIDILEDARTNNIPVVIADHFPPTTNRQYVDKFDTPFMSGVHGMEREYGITWMSVDGVSAVDLVDDFMDAGGEFVCWLCGHLHYGVVDVLKDHERQIYIAIESANWNAVYRDVQRDEYGPTTYLMNLVSVDTYFKTIRVQRIGAEWDELMRHRGSLCISYDTREMIYTN